MRYYQLKRFQTKDNTVTPLQMTTGDVTDETTGDQDEATSVDVTTEATDGG